MALSYFSTLFLFAKVRRIRRFLHRGLDDDGLTAAKIGRLLAIKLFGDRGTELNSAIMKQRKKSKIVYSTKCTDRGK